MALIRRSDGPGCNRAVQGCARQVGLVSGNHVSTVIISTMLLTPVPFAFRHRRREDVCLTKIFFLLVCVGFEQGRMQE